ncbi:uncharacterized protein ARB_01701 [Trichophyton benhamiae CBS 112371]|uniref:Uncharacterized protein n=1 Tax=Arthroderma benhamiae (strain ATCC MYA-4681 / CBS 112371) TaxID=663331 RepID=D4AZT1_ARTBC|nr:uncharacterized protein ARB_01701 [Trichophyton benhamiae CBS 112371]EFE31306.1 hypothetical protein ARB_01701 [Trichophyton benhamiae CBS 112371]
MGFVQAAGRARRETISRPDIFSPSAGAAWSSCRRASGLCVSASPASPGGLLVFFAGALRCEEETGERRAGKKENRIKQEKKNNSSLSCPSVSVCLSVCLSVTVSGVFCLSSTAGEEEEEEEEEEVFSPSLIFLFCAKKEVFEKFF